jgi:hypothetical protein
LEHRCGGGVTQAVRADRRQASPLAGVTHGGADGTSGERSMGRAQPAEHRGAARSGATRAQPGDDRLADVDWQRETFDAAAFHPHTELTPPPVDIAEPEAGDLTGTQPESRQHRQDREVAPSHGAGTVAAVKQRLNLVDAEISGDTGECPSGRGRHRCAQQRRCQPAPIQEAQQ